jgi:hypothetical protein
MNIYATDIMTLFFILFCCLCSFLLLLVGFILYILGSARVRSALVALSLIKTVIEIFKDVRSVFKATKSSSRNSTKVSKKENVLDAEFREKK